MKIKAVCFRFSNLLTLNIVSSQFHIAVCKSWFRNLVPCLLNLIGLQISIFKWIRDKGLCFILVFLTPKLMKKSPVLKVFVTQQIMIHWCLVQLGSFCFIVRRMLLFSAILRNTSSFFKRSVQMITSILLQHHISKGSKQFWSTFGTVQVAAPNKAVIQNLALY